MESKPLDLPKEWVDKIKRDAAPYESATQHEGLGPAIYEDGAMTYAPWLYTCQMNYATLQAKCEQQAQDIEQYKEIAKDYGHTSDKIFKRDKEIEELAARCDRYEKALKEVIEMDGHIKGMFEAKKAANEALNVEGKEELPEPGKWNQCTCTVHRIAAHGKCHRCPENQKEDKQC